MAASTTHNNQPAGLITSSLLPVARRQKHKHRHSQACLFVLYTSVYIRHSQACLSVYTVY